MMGMLLTKKTSEACRPEDFQKKSKTVDNSWYFIEAVHAVDCTQLSGKS